MRIMEESRLPPEQKKTIVPVIITRISLLLKGCKVAQEQMEKDDGYRLVMNIRISNKIKKPSNSQHGFTGQNGHITKDLLSIVKKIENHILDIFNDFPQIFG